MFNFLANLFSARKHATTFRRKRSRRAKSRKRRQYCPYPLLPIEQQVPHPDTPEAELLKHPWYRRQKAREAAAKAAEAAE